MVYFTFNIEQKSLFSEIMSRRNELSMKTILLDLIRVSAGFMKVNVSLFRNLFNEKVKKI